MSYMAYLSTGYGPQQVIPVEIKPRKIEGDVTNTSELEKKLKEYIDTRIKEISDVISKLPVDVTKMNDLKNQIKNEIKAEISAYMCSDCVKVTDYNKDKSEFNNLIRDEFNKQITDLESRITMKGNMVIDRVTKLENEAKSLSNFITSSGLTTFQAQLTYIKSKLESGPTVAVDMKVLEEIANLEKKFIDEIKRIEGKLRAEIDTKLAGYQKVDTTTLSDECKKYVNKIKKELEGKINDKMDLAIAERTKILQRIKSYEDKLDAHIRGPHTELITELEELSGKIGTLDAEHHNINTRLDALNAEHRNINTRLDAFNAEHRAIGATIGGINDKLLDLEGEHRNIAGKLMTLQQLQDDFNLFKNQIYDMYNQLITVARAILIEQGERINNANNSIKELNELVKTLMKLLIKTNFMNKDEVKTVEKQMEKINNTVVRTFPALVEGNIPDIRQNLRFNANLEDLLKGLQQLRMPSPQEKQQPFKPFALPAPAQPQIQPQIQPPPTISQMDEQLRAETARLEAERIASIEEAARAEAQRVSARNEAERLAAIKKQEELTKKREEITKKVAELRQIQLINDRETKENALRAYLNEQCKTQNIRQCTASTRMVPYNFNDTNLGECPANRLCKIEDNNCVANMDNFTYRDGNMEFGRFNTQGNFTNLSRNCKPVKDDPKQQLREQQQREQQQREQQRKKRQEEEILRQQQLQQAKDDAARRQKDAEEKRIAATKTLKEQQAAKAKSAQSLADAQRLTDTIREAEERKRILDQQARMLAATPNVPEYSQQIQSALNKQTREESLREYLNQQCMTDDKGQCAAKTRQVPLNFEGKDLGNCPADLTCKLEKNKCIANMSNVTYRPQTDSFELGTLDMNGNFDDLSKRCKNAAAELAKLRAQQQAAEEAARIAAEEEARKAQQAAEAARAAAEAAQAARLAAEKAQRDAAMIVQQAIADAVKAAAEKERKQLEEIARVAAEAERLRREEEARAAAEARAAQERETRLKKFIQKWRTGAQAIGQQKRLERERIERERIEEIKRLEREAKQREKEAKDRKRAELNNELRRLENEKRTVERRFYSMDKQIIELRLRNELKEKTESFSDISQRFDTMGQMKQKPPEFVELRNQKCSLDKEIKQIEKQLTPEGIDEEIQKMINKEVESIQARINEITDELGQLGGGEDELQYGGGDDDISITSEELTQYNLLSATSEGF